MAETDPFWADPEDDDPAPAPGVGASEIARWERLHGVTLPGPLRDVLARRNGGVVRGGDVEINRLEEIQPVDAEFWEWACFRGDEPADRGLFFMLGWDPHFTGRFLIDFNARGREDEPTVHLYYSDPGDVEDVADSLAEFFLHVRTTDAAPTVEWPGPWDDLDLVARETLTGSTVDEVEWRLEQVLVRQGDDLVLWTRKQSYGGEERSRTLLPTPLDSRWAVVKPLRPEPNPTFALHIQPTDHDGIACESSERREDGWRNATSRGAPIYVMFESRDRERLEALRARLLGSEEAEAARQRERRDAELQARLDGLSPEARLATMTSAAEKLREETDRMFRETNPDPSPLAPEHRALLVTLQRKVSEAMAKAREQSGGAVPDPEALKLLEDSLRPPDPGGPES